MSRLYEIHVLINWKLHGTQSRKDKQILSVPKGKTPIAALKSLSEEKQDRNIKRSIFREKKLHCYIVYL